MHRRVTKEDIESGLVKQGTNLVQIRHTDSDIPERVIVLNTDDDFYIKHIHENHKEGVDWYDNFEIEIENKVSSWKKRMIG